jgi:hypothetical protein
VGAAKMWRESGTVGASSCVVAGDVSGVERGQRQRMRRERWRRRCRAAHRCGLGLVAQDQAVVVEVVAGIHADSGRKLAAHGDFEIGIEQRDLDAVDPSTDLRG